MAKVKETFNNLIDLCITLEEMPEYTGKADEMFRHLLTNYFFKQETYQSKSIELILNEYKVPESIKGLKSLFELGLEELKNHVEGSTFNDSLAGKVLLSPQYLKAYFPHHPPSFSKLPEDVKFELLDRIKEKNGSIIAAFEKMEMDKQADKSRKIITLIALILKNICKKSGKPLAKISDPAEVIIKKIFNNTSEVFNGSQRQFSELGDDTKIKELLKTFFVIRQFSEINDLTRLYRAELTRYRKRGIKTGTA